MSVFCYTDRDGVILSKYYVIITNLAGISKFKQERKNDDDSGS